MKFRILALLLFTTSLIFAQNEVKIYTEREGSQVVVYVDNPAVIPMTVDISLKLTNMKTDFGGTKRMFVIPQLSKRYKILSANAIRRNGRTGLGLESFIYVGDVKQKPDSKFLYELPFEAGETYIVSQGYDGRFSHRGENAIDFALDIGEKVYAARGGIVYKVVEEHSRSCHQSSCQEFNNYITVYHSDGTFSEYSHLKYNGANVEIGDIVEAGDFLGYSGNTGWSSGPHLHFVVYKYNNKGVRETLKTKFKTTERKSIILEENEHYTKPLK